MLAVVVDNGELRVEERPDPVPGDTEVLVAVAAAGLNGADMLQRRGRYPAPPGVPADVPGLELAGEVVQAGPKVSLARRGDRVMALVAGGGQATMAVVDESHLLPVPASLAWPEAGGFPEVFSTAFDALFTRCGLSTGDRLLVTGAAGGVGVAAVQLGAAAGASVVASVRDPQRREQVATLGAHEVVGTDDLADHGPYDVVLELVGAASLPQVLPALATGGRVAVIGVGSGARIELDLLTLMGKRATIGGSTLRVRNRGEKAAVAQAVRAHVLPLLADGRVRVPLCSTFPLADVTRAYDRFVEGKKLGKIVLVTGDV
ncbi:MAG TPA: zinc-binding dehydrogenase [Acidimicrobiales bacterium]|nr:zinc-binding dehydrogenase [Acidimicrobiales bacterium]